jgi:acetylxylan esterase
MNIQGGQIMDNALCGGAGATLTGTALAAVKAAIFMGDPHNVNGLPYNVGTCKNKGVSDVEMGEGIINLPGVC